LAKKANVAVHFWFDVDWFDGVGNHANEGAVQVFVFKVFFDGCVIESVGTGSWVVLVGLVGGSRRR
jgi:hypothetical protein